jgi:hypothetical protein
MARDIGLLVLRLAGLYLAIGQSSIDAVRARK